MKYRYIRLQLEIVCIFKKNDEIIALEKRKLDILGKERTVKEDDDLTYECFKSLLPHMKCLPHIRRPRLHWERFFSEYFSFPTVIVILPVFHTHSFICHQCYMIVEVGNVVCVFAHLRMCVRVVGDPVSKMMCLYFFLLEF